jgi:hypothetical protein
MIKDSPSFLKQNENKSNLNFLFQKTVLRKINKLNKGINWILKR